MSQVMTRCFPPLARRLQYFLLILATMLNVGAASAQAPFYQGKTIKLIVGTSAGDLYDQWARVLTPTLAKNLPGTPDALVQNMPGAGHRVAANYLFNIAKPDGLTLAATILPSLYFDQLIGRKEVQFDWSRFTWIGSPVQEEHVFFVRTDTPYKTLEDIRRAGEPPKCGATGLGSTGYYLPRLIEETLAPSSISSPVILAAPSSTSPSSAVNCNAVPSPSRLTSPIENRSTPGARPAPFAR